MSNIQKKAQEVRSMFSKLNKDMDTAKIKSNNVDRKIEQLDKS